MITILSALFGLTIAVSAAPVLPAVPVDTWMPAVGDRMIVDTEANIGYLVHEDGVYTSFPVLTGQKRVVRYIGRTYNAATPSKSWHVRSMDVKGRSMTFGETGTFLRLYDGDEETAYGIHSHLTFQKMLGEGDRYRSMGCVLVSEDILALIVETYALNKNDLAVVTAFGIDLPEPTIADLSAKPSWLGL